MILLPVSMSWIMMLEPLYTVNSTKRLCPPLRFSARTQLVGPIFIANRPPPIIAMSLNKTIYTLIRFLLIALSDTHTHHQKTATISISSKTVPNMKGLPNIALHFIDLSVWQPSITSLTSTKKINS